MGLEFLDLTAQLDIARIDSNDVGGQRQEDVYQITNSSSSIVDTHLLMIARGLSFEIEMENASGRTSTGDPYHRLFLSDGVLLPGQSIVARLRFKRRSSQVPRPRRPPAADPEPTFRVAACSTLRSKETLGASRGNSPLAPAWTARTS